MPHGSDPQAVAARIASALRVRALHAALLRRAETAKAAGQPMPPVPDNDPLGDATVILAGRGRSYPLLSVGLGQQTGLIGVLTIEVAARYLKSRDADGLVIGDGFAVASGLDDNIGPGSGSDSTTSVQGTCSLHVDNASLTRSSSQNMITANATDGLSITTVTAPLAAGTHTFALRCLEEDGDIDWGQSRITAVMLGNA